jgi:hypothetical protein
MAGGALLVVWIIGVLIDDLVHGAIMKALG